MIDYEFSLNQHKMPLLTLALHGVSFNEQCIALLNYPDYVCMVLNKNQKLLAVKADGSFDESVRKYPFLINRKKKRFVHLCSSKIIKEILALTATDPCNNAIKFKASFDSLSQMLIVDLSKPLTFF